MTSRFDIAVHDACDRSFAKMIAPGGWLRERIRRDVRWILQGFEPGYGTPERGAFTETVAARIHDKARKRLTVLGLRLWLVREDRERCEREAEEIVTRWLDNERIKFGDPRFHWDNGHDIADEEMSYWETA